MAKRTVRELDLEGRRVLVRADLNVPLDAAAGISDDRRIQLFLPTLRHIVAHRGRAVLMSHLGRPKGDHAADRKLSLAPVASRISDLLGTACGFVEDCVGDDALAATRAMGDGDVLLLENLRFHPAETIIDNAKKNPDGKLTPEQAALRESFAAALAANGDLYVNDAFGTCHRNHVSMYDVPRLMGGGRRAIGFLVEKELEYLGRALESPQRPFVAVLGGAKVSDKIGVVRSLLERVDRILIGGAMMYTFWAAKGIAVGKSLCEQERIELAGELISAAGDKLVLPSDTVFADRLEAGAARHVAVGEVPPEQMGLDVGPETVTRFSEILRGARTIVWNGPLGAFETPPFDAGTNAIARVIAEAGDAGAVTVIGGGDSASAMQRAGLAERMTHISTGGGASLKFLEGKRFEPIEIIDDV